MNQKQNDIVYCRLNGSILLIMGMLIILLFVTRIYAEQELDTVGIENSKISIIIDSNDASILSITNKQTDERFGADAVAFQVIVDGNLICSDNCDLVEKNIESETITYIFKKQDLKFKLSYNIEPDNYFVQKTFSIKNTGTIEHTLNQISMENIRFVREYEKFHPHNDNTSFDCPICLFVEFEKSGIFMGIENPYFKMVEKEKTIALFYQPEWTLNPGETFESDNEFLGVFKKEGIYCFKQLHWEPRTVVTEQEIMDLGQVWAMQDYMRATMPAQKLPHPGFFTLANTCMAALDFAKPKPGFLSPPGNWGKMWHDRFYSYTVEPIKNVVDIAKELGQIDNVGLATIWFGNAGYAAACPDLYLEKLDENFEIRKNKYWKQVVEYARKQGFTTGGMDEPARSYLIDRADLKILTKDGKRLTSNCFANKWYTDWYLEQIDRALSENDELVMWGWDWGWLDRTLSANFAEYGLCYKFPGCWDRSHGHASGNCGYQAYRNVKRFLAELKKRHPDKMLRVCWGVKSCGPWLMRVFDEAEMLSENILYYTPEGMSLADENRFQAWFTQNYKFIPNYKNMSEVHPRCDSRGMEYSLLSAISISDHTQFGELPFMYENKQKEESDQRFWRKWRRWADEHFNYLRVKRDLFGHPFRSDCIDGSAHIINDNGFIFIFNPTEKDIIAEIPLNEWIGLIKGDSFIIKEIYPGEEIIGTLKIGESVSVVSPSGKAVVLAIEPGKDDKKHPIKRVPENLEVQKAFLNWEDIQPYLEKHQVSEDIPPDIEVDI